MMLLLARKKESRGTSLLYDLAVAVIFSFHHQFLPKEGASLITNQQINNHLLLLLSQY